jgi:hypothetical protein
MKMASIKYRAEAGENIRTAALKALHIAEAAETQVELIFNEITIPVFPEHSFTIAAWYSEKLNNWRSK